MKIYLPNTSSQSLGGGFTFYRNFKKGLKGKIDIVDNFREADVVMITGVTMTDRKEMEIVESAGIPIVLRVDNMPKDSRNRGTAFSRMRDFSRIADHIIFQSEWAKDYVGWWLENKVGAEAMRNKNTSVIYNGVDKEFFHFEDKPEERPDVYLFVQYNRDENKRFPEAALDFYKVSRENPRSELWCIGRFSDDAIEYNFDFFSDENVKRHAPVEDPELMGNLMRMGKYFYFPAYADASPNTLSEALCCGLKPLLINNEGGSLEVVQRYNDGKIEDIQTMGEHYLDIFNSLL